MNKTSIIINGAYGKMGQITVATIEAHDQFECVAKNGHHDDLEKTIQETKATIVIDFSRADAGFDIATTVINNNAHLVSGTSGFLPEHITQLKALCREKNLGAIIAPNFSIGAVLMMQAAAKASQYFERAEIIDMHHDQKADAPSGTAIKTAEMLTPQKTKPLTETETIARVRGGTHHHIPIHSVRLPGLLAHQQIMLGNPGEILTLRHDMLDRKACMAGVILACQSVTKLTDLVYGLEHILE